MFYYIKCYTFPQFLSPNILFKSAEKPQYFSTMRTFTIFIKIKVIVRPEGKAVLVFTEEPSYYVNFHSILFMSTSFFTVSFEYDSINMPSVRFELTTARSSASPL